MLDERSAARAARDWAASDRLRDELLARGHRRRGHARRPALATARGGGPWLIDRRTTGARERTATRWPAARRPRGRAAPDGPGGPPGGFSRGGPRRDAGPLRGPRRDGPPRDQGAGYGGPRRDGPSRGPGFDGPRSDGPAVRPAAGRPAWTPGPVPTVRPAPRSWRPAAAPVARVAPVARLVLGGRPGLGRTVVRGPDRAIDSGRVRGSDPEDRRPDDRHDRTPRRAVATRRSARRPASRLGGRPDYRPRPGGPPGRRSFGGPPGGADADRPRSWSGGDRPYPPQGILVAAARRAGWHCPRRRPSVPTRSW